MKQIKAALTIVLFGIGFAVLALVTIAILTF